MANKNKMIKVGVATLVLIAYAISEYFPHLIPGSGLDPSDNTLLQRAITNQTSDVQVSGNGKVIKLLPDDNKGSRHQRFLVKINPQSVVLIAHNIDLAPRLNDLEYGDTIRFSGEYEWNQKGGVVHWTHKDPRGKHIHGWLEHNDIKYW